MNTEPPEGDDLHRMLVSMKQNVLERATPRPKRRTPHTGIVITVVGLLALGTATGAVALTLSHRDDVTASAPTQTSEPQVPAPSTASSAPITATPKPVPTPTRTPPRDVPATIPTDCRALVPAKDYDRFFASTPVTRVTPVAPGLTPDHTPPPDNVDPRSAPTALYCLWRDPRADISGMSITLGTGTPAQLAENERSFYEGWSPTCDEQNGIRTCRASRKDPEYGTDWARTLYIRGDTWLQIDQSNFPTDGLLPAVIGEVWGD